MADNSRSAKALGSQGLFSWRASSKVATAGRNWTEIESPGKKREVESRGKLQWDLFYNFFYNIGQIQIQICSQSLGSRSQINLEEAIFKSREEDNDPVPELIIIIIVFIVIIEPVSEPALHLGEGEPTVGVGVPSQSHALTLDLKESSIKSLKVVRGGFMCFFHKGKIEKRMEAGGDIALEEEMAPCSVKTENWQVGPDPERVVPGKYQQLQYV